MSVTKTFGCNVFNDLVMRERLPRDVYRSLKQTIDEGTALDYNIATVVANALKDWAIEKGATHYTHWFQPMTGITAEKHDSFISPTGDGRAIMEFSGKELVKGEPDASSFPSGGLRATFEARGYTAWDPTSNAFVKEGTLYIPSVFSSYSGESLDNKTPLLRSMDAIDTQAKRLLALFGRPAKRVVPSVGAEQEYFLVDKELFDRRYDLIYTGRTLFGARPPKGQQLGDHYFGNLKERIACFMHQLDEELWKMGVYSKTKHNETAPAQHELAPIFTSANLAADQNQLIMETMKRVAKHHGLICLLHEKPFANINGSGKHNNWSISTLSGENLLDPGKGSPADNKLFLLVLCAILKAVDDYQDLFRVSVASASNDHRLGSHEAPPAIMSVFLGSDMTAILEAAEKGLPAEECPPGFIRKNRMGLGVCALPQISKDNSDRNRTSPFAFTGNKFEFRMVGSSESISSPNVILNTTVAESFRQFSDTLEQAEDFDAAVNCLIAETYCKHRRIVFNGNNYSQEWVDEAAARGLLNLQSTPDAVARFTDQKNIDLFRTHGIFSPTEVQSRAEMQLDGYIKTLDIEALTMAEMARRDIIPAACEYLTRLNAATASCKEAGIAAPKSCNETAKKIAELTDTLHDRLTALEQHLETADGMADTSKLELAGYYRRIIHDDMEALRAAADSLEQLVGRQLWPFPTYGDLLYRI